MKIKRVKEIPVEPKKRGRPKGSKNKPKPLWRDDPGLAPERLPQISKAPAVKHCDANAKYGHDFQAKVGFTNPVCSKCGARKRGRPSLPKQPQPTEEDKQFIKEIVAEALTGSKIKGKIAERKARVVTSVAKPQPKSQPDPDNPFVTKYGWSKKNKAEPCPKCGLIEVEGGYCTRCLNGWEKPAPYTPDRKETTGGPSTAVTEASTVQVTPLKYTVPLVHPRYSIERCPKCGYPEADGGYCPECGWLGGSVGVT